MTVKQWLSQAREIDAEVEQLRAVRRHAWSAATGVSPRLDGVGRRSNARSRRFEALAELDDEIDRRLAALTQAKAAVLRSVAMLQDPRHRQVLTAYYVDCRLPDGRRKTWEMVAVELSVSWRWLMQLHADALAALAAALPVVDENSA